MRADEGVVNQVHSRGLFRRLVLGVGSTVLGQAINAAQTILLVPLFLRAWGVTTYGTWLALSALISYVMLIDLGGQNYVGNLLAMDFARHDMEAFGKKLSASVSMFVFIALATFAVVAACVLLIPLSQSTGGGGTLGPLDRKLIVLFLSGSLLISVPAGVYATAYRATGQFVRGAMVGNVCRLAELALYATLLAVRVRPVTYAATMLAITVVRTAVVSWDIHSHILHRLSVSINPRLVWEGRVYLGGSLLFWTIALASGVNQQGVLLVLTVAQGPLAVALYSTHRTAAGLVGYVGRALQAPLWAEFSMMWAREGHEQMRRVALMALRSVVLIGGLASVVVYFFLPIVYPLWTGRQLSLQPLLLILFLVQAVLASAWSTASWTLLASNRQRLPACCDAANAAVTLGLGLALAPRYGVVGVALATLAGDVLFGLMCYPRLANRFLGLPRWTMERTIFSALLALVPLCLGTALIMRGMPLTLALPAFVALVVVWAGLVIVGVAGRDSLTRVCVSVCRFIV